MTLNFLKNYIDKNSNDIMERVTKEQLNDMLVKGAILTSKAIHVEQQLFAKLEALNETELLNVISDLNKIEVFPRRYFYPSLNNLPYLDQKIACPVSENISSRIICLPLYVGLEDENIIKICDSIKKSLGK